MPFCYIDNQLTVFSFYDNKDMPGFLFQIYSQDPVQIKDPLLEEDITWPTIEHFYHAQKILNKEERQRFIQESKSANVNECRTLINNFKHQDPNWHIHETKQNVMLQALRAKYNQLPNLRLALDLTDNLPIIEDNACAAFVDNIWGCGVDGSGENWLGVLWMQIRAEMRDSKAPDTARKEALLLQEEAKLILQYLGKRDQLLQDHPKVISAKKLEDLPIHEKKTVKKEADSIHACTENIQKEKIPPSSPSKRYDLLDFARRFLLRTQPGESKSLTARDNSIIKYGHSEKEEDTFYIEGNDINGCSIQVRVCHAKIYENGHEVSVSNWANWAIRLIPVQNLFIAEIPAPLLFTHGKEYSERPSKRFVSHSVSPLSEALNSTTDPQTQQNSEAKGSNQYFPIKF